jgi:antitoxin YefM
MREYSYTQVRQNLSKILNAVCDDCEEVYVTRKNGDRVVIVPASDYESLKETAYLLSTDANRQELMRSLDEAECGHVHPMEDLFK